MIRLIALDIDGTLLDSRGQIPASAVEAIARARAQGVRVVLSSGRSAREAAWFNQAALCDSMAVCLGGCAVADLSAGRHIRQWAFSPAAAAALEQLVDASFQVVFFAGEELLVTPASAVFFTRHYPGNLLRRFQTITEAPWQYAADHGLAPCKLLVLGEADRLAWLRRAASEIADLHITSSDSTNLELMPAGADKGRALSLLCGQWGVPMEETAALGDSENDREMLSAVGISVAMGNAPAAIRQAARLVTDTNDNDGLAKALHRLLES